MMLGLNSCIICHNKMISITFRDSTGFPTDAYYIIVRPVLWIYRLRPTGTLPTALTKNDLLLYTRLLSCMSQFCECHSEVSLLAIPVILALGM